MIIPVKPRGWEHIRGSRDPVGSPTAFQVKLQSPGLVLKSCTLWGQLPFQRFLWPPRPLQYSQVLGLLQGQPLRLLLSLPQMLSLQIFRLFYCF